MTHTRFLTACLLGALTVACSDEATNPGEAELNRDLDRVRAATARFQDVNVALAEGYAPISECVSMPGTGAMGIHYAKMPLLGDADYSMTAPEVLLYEPQPNGSMKFIGVEYVIVQDAWHAAGRTGLPAFRDQPFDITPAHDPNPALYTLHAWTVRANPAGVFTPFNSAVSCPTSTAAVDGSTMQSHAH